MYDERTIEALESAYGRPFVRSLTTRPDGTVEATITSQPVELPGGVTYRAFSVGSGRKADEAAAWRAAEKKLVSHAPRDAWLPGAHNAWTVAECGVRGARAREIRGSEDGRWLSGERAKRPWLGE